MKMMIYKKYLIIKIKMDKIKIIKNEIEKMSLLENSEIFNIIKKSNSNYSKNINGIFIDLKKIDIKIIDNLYNYIIYCKKLKKNMNEFENTKNVIKDSLENDNKANIIEETLIENELIEQNPENVVVKNKISSTMKFYILKKKLIKTNNCISNNIFDELEYDTPYKT
jgi:hypothetical protein